MNCQACPYKKLLEQFADQLKELHNCIPDPAKTPTPGIDFIIENEAHKKQLTLPQIALIAYYNKWYWSADGLRDLASNYGRKVSQSTGRKLKEILNKLDYPSNRLHCRESKRDILAVLNYLDGSAWEKANKDLLVIEE